MPSDLLPFLPLLVAASAAFAVSIAGVWLSRKMGLTPQQAKYVEQLTGMNEAYARQVDFQTELLSQKNTELEDQKKKIDSLTKTVEEQQDQINDLRQEVFELRQQMSEQKPRRRRIVKPEDEE